MGSISTRQHIRWGCDAPSEPTSTLVITSPGRHFVDIRILKTAYHDAPSAMLPLASLDWAFAGSSSSYQITRPDGAQATHAVFKHWVDSRTAEPEAITDEGDMLPDPSDAQLISETGTMVNPETGIITEYQELWRDQEPQFVMDGAAGRVQVLVMRLHDDSKGIRGLWVRVGMDAQGVLRVGNKFTAERWHCADTTWRRKFKAGDQEIGGFESLATHSWGPHPNMDETIETTDGVWKAVEIKVADVATVLPS